ncbi:uncharacterized protein TRAVEDRAFT_99074, partial [Trametes versicolor FP-101664 SS1]|uniref:uncharacterized protein n=1 Tax=Trametes versicolor (strain FP-101664) TaxID=717944 RepID=UPI0004622602
TKDLEFWFEDGNVILVAQDYEFRVFKGVLAHHSSVFRDMFSLSRPISAAPVESSAVVDACLVVHLSDSPEDLRHILRTYLPGINPNQQNPSFDAVSALIRLGHKYQMQALVAQGVQYLKRCFTDDLRTWSAGKFYDSNCPIQKRHAIGIVNLARLINEPSLLPTALLICCALDSDIVCGYTREDGTQETLTLADIGRCFAAR